jgi:hypothetical protein
MANLYRAAEDAFLKASFRHINLIDSLNESQLRQHGYQVGYPCPHGHLIRDSEGHWCYHCAKKILSNVCGFDVNYLHQDYKVKYASLWKKVEIGFPEDCWTIKTPSGGTPKRVCMPSYRSGYSKQKSENVNIHKALYQCAWGDVGALVVTRVCGNAKCGNPLHMVSSWNRNTPPQALHPFDTEFKAEKLMMYARQVNTGKDTRSIVEKDYKPTITHPLDVKEVPDYDEG